MSVAGTAVVQDRINSENYNSGTSAVTGAIGQLLNAAWDVIGSDTAVAIDPVTVANMQSYFFTVDQGTVANPVVVEFTSDTSATVTLNMVAGIPYYWDVNQRPVTTHQPANRYGIFSGDNSSGTVTAFGNIASATYNIPSALSVATVNFTGRIVSN